MPFPTDDAIEDEDYNVWICGSLNRNQRKMNELFEAINPVCVSRVAGSGNKTVYLLDQKADYYINLVPGFKYWDMCASEALMLARMGVVTDACQRPIIYDHTKDNYTIREGIIMAKNKKVYDVCSRRIHERLGKDVKTLHEEVLREVDVMKMRQRQELKSKPAEIKKIHLNGE